MPFYDVDEEIPLPPHEVRDSVSRLTRDLARSAATLSKAQARFYVTQYYQVQHNRITALSQKRDSEKAEQPHELTNWYLESNEVLEGQIKRALDKWTDAHFISRWAKSIIGVGPVIAAGLLAHIDLQQKKKITDEATGDEVEITIIRATASAIWTYAGLNQVSTGECGVCAGLGYLPQEDDEVHVPRSIYDMKQIGMEPCPRCFGAGKLSEGAKWLPKQKRPWNAELKVLVAFKLGESFVKVQNNKADFYGKVYATRKMLEQSRNARKLFAPQAEQILKAKNIRKTTDAYKAYIEGMLPPAHIHARARRFASKLFISHYHYMLFRNQFGKEPRLRIPWLILGMQIGSCPPMLILKRNKSSLFSS